MSSLIHTCCCVVLCGLLQGVPRPSPRLLLLLMCPACAPCPLLLQSQVSGLQRERAKLSILQDAVIVASTLSFAGATALQLQGKACTAQRAYGKCHANAGHLLPSISSALTGRDALLNCTQSWLACMHVETRAGLAGRATYCCCICLHSCTGLDCDQPNTPCMHFHPRQHPPTAAQPRPCRRLRCVPPPGQAL